MGRTISAYTASPQPWGPTVMSNHRLALSATSAYLRNPVSCDKRRHSTWNVPASAQGRLALTHLYHSMFLRSTYDKGFNTVVKTRRCIHYGQTLVVVRDETTDETRT